MPDTSQTKALKKEQKKQRKEAQKPKNRKKLREQKHALAQQRFEQNFTGPLFLHKYNRMILHLFLTPLFTLLYYPLNRYVMLPLLGDGSPYLNTKGETVEHYFSATHLAWLFAFLLTGITLYFSVRNTKRIQTVWKRILYLIICIYVTGVTFLLFINFSLWV